MLRQVFSARCLHPMCIYHSVQCCLATVGFSRPQHQYKIEALMRKNPSISPKKKVETVPAGLMRAYTTFMLQAGLV